jgi:hypothetical protein
MLMACLVLVVAALLPSVSHMQPADAVCFNETGYCISGRFRTYWEQHGGLPVFGYPISPAAEETNPLTGEQRLTQWFERTRFELHPENAPPYDVLLGRIGADLLEAWDRNWWSFPPGTPRDGCLYFEATTHTLCEPFLTFWQLHGLELDGIPGKTYAESLALIGAPISEPRWELHGGLNASVRLTQWFERARFEWNVEQSEMLLGLLGAELYALRAPIAPPEPTAVPQPTIVTPSPGTRPTAARTATPRGADDEPDDEPDATRTPTRTVEADDEPDATRTPTATSETDATTTPTTTATPSPSPTLPPASFDNCRDDPNKARASNFPVDIVWVDKNGDGEDEVVRLRNVSDETVDLDDWTMCSIAGNQEHTGIGGELEPDEARDFPYTGSGGIWDDDNVDNGALYNRQGQLVSYWFDPE